MIVDAYSQVRALAEHGHAVLLVEQKAQAALKLADIAYVLVQGRAEMAAPPPRCWRTPPWHRSFSAAGAARVKAAGA